MKSKTALMGFAVTGLSAALASAQGTAASEITDGIGDMITSGGVVAVAAIGIFVAVMAVQVIKKFARAGK